MTDNCNDGLCLTAPFAACWCQTSCNIDIQFVLLISAIPDLQVLVQELPLLLASMTFKRSMRWRGSTAFSRPLRWLMALHGSTALPFSYAGRTATYFTPLLRHSPYPICQVSPPSPPPFPPPPPPPPRYPPLPSSAYHIYLMLQLLTAMVEVCMSPA